MQHQWPVLVWMLCVLCEADDSLAYSPKLDMTDLIPQQIHISLGDTSTDMTIMWATKKYDVSIAEYHTGDRTLAQQVEGETRRLESSNEDGLQYLHHVKLTKLTPQTKYYYLVRGEADDTLSDQFSFTVPPVTEGNTHTFMVYGDLGTKSRDLQFLLQEARNEKYEALFHVGDIAYDLNSEEGKIGDKFLDTVETVAARIPYMTVPGDHESAQQFLHYRYRFAMPNLPWPMPSDKLWYSIDIGQVHFVMYSTEVFFEDEYDSVEKMLEWMKNDLDKANTRRSAVPWIVAMGHRPMYCSTEDITEDCRRERRPLVRSALEELFFEAGVDLIISGHIHDYERTWPVYKKGVVQYNYKEPTAPVHILIGTLGSAYKVDKSTPVEGHVAAFLPSENSKESFGKLKVFNATHLYWEVRECSHNKLVDRMWIIQSYHRRFNQPFLPNPLGNMGESWMAQSETESFGLENFLGFKGSHYGDDYQTKLTVLICVFVICIFGMVARKRVLDFIRICCFRKEKLKNGIHSAASNI